MEGDFPKQMKCPVCLEIPAREIFQCQNGHTICSDCSKNLTTCPQCRVNLGFTKIRCRALEDMLDMIQFNCEYKSKGCEIKSRRGEIVKHISDCTFGGTTIEVCKSIGFNCTFACNTKSLGEAVKHFRDEHGLMVKSKGDVSIKIEDFIYIKKNQASIWMPIVLNMESTNESIFLLVCSFNGSDETFSLSCLEVKGNANEAKESKFRAEFRIEPVDSSRASALEWSVAPLDARFVKEKMNPVLRLSIRQLLKNFVLYQGIVVACTITPQGGIKRESKTRALAELVSTYNMHNDIAGNNNINLEFGIKRERHSALSRSRVQEVLLPRENLGRPSFGAENETEDMAVYGRGVPSPPFPLTFMAPASVVLFVVVVSCYFFVSHDGIRNEAKTQARAELVSTYNMHQNIAVSDNNNLGFGIKEENHSALRSIPLKKIQMSENSLFSFGGGKVANGTALNGLGGASAPLSTTFTAPASADSVPYQVPVFGNVVSTVPTDQTKLNFDFMCPTPSNFTVTRRPENNLPTSAIVK